MAALGKLAILTEQELSQIIREAVQAAVGEALRAAKAEETAYSSTQLLTRFQLAKRFQVTPGHISKLMERGLPSLGHGRQRRFRLNEVEAWMQNQPTEGARGNSH